MTQPVPGNDRAIDAAAAPSPASSTAAQSRDAAAFSTGYQYYALGLLFVVYIFNFIDRSVVNILAESIIEELDLADWQFGMLSGGAFALFYATLGVPIARLADVWSRVRVLAICLALWSGMTAVCGLAQNFLQILAARVGVAVGEAGGSPPAHSIISDMFPPERRSTALAVYALGIPVGTALGYLFGGDINQMFGWRWAFVIVGLPGLLAALIVWLTLREPSRGASEGRVMADGEAPPVTEVFAYLWSRKSFRYMSLGAGLHAFVGYGVGAWIPAMFIRSHEWTSSEIGRGLAILGIAGMFGTFMGGWISDRLAVYDRRWYMWMPGLATFVSVPFAAFTYLWGDPLQALAVYIVPYVLGSFYLGPTFAMTQSLVGLRMRALASGILLFILNIIGFLLGPFLTGALSDIYHATTDLGVHSLRWALVTVLVINLASSLFYWLASLDLRGDLDRAVD